MLADDDSAFGPGPSDAAHVVCGALRPAPELVFEARDTGGLVDELPPRLRDPKRDTNFELGEGLRNDRRQKARQVG